MAIVSQNKLKDEIYASLSDAPGVLKQVEVQLGEDGIDVGRLKAVKKGVLRRTAGEAVVMVTKVERFDKDFGWLVKGKSCVVVAAALSKAEADAVYGSVARGPELFFDFVSTNVVREKPIYLAVGSLSEGMESSGMLFETREHVVGADKLFGKAIQAGREMQHDIGLPVFGDLSREQDVLRRMAGNERSKGILADFAKSLEERAGDSLLGGSSKDFARLSRFNLAAVLGEDKPARKGKAVVVVVDWCLASKEDKVMRGEIVLASGLSEEKATRMMYVVSQDINRFVDKEKNGVRILKAHRVDVKSNDLIEPVPMVGDLRNSEAYNRVASEFRDQDISQYQARQRYAAKEAEMAR